MAKQFSPEVVWLPIEKITPYPLNNKLHPPSQIDAIAGSILEFGWDVPIVTDEEGVILKGHGRHLAARKLGLKDVPVIVRADLSPAQKKACRIADNKVSVSDWDMDSLKVELESLKEMNFDLELTGFNLDECDSLFNLGTIDFQGAQIFGESGNLTEPKQPEVSHALSDDAPPVPNDSTALESGNNELVKSDGSLLELTQITIAEPRHQVEKGQVWKVGPHVLVIAEVLTEWQSWKDFLTGDRTLFAPYPGPFVPLTVKAEEYHLVMVQPDAYIAGHILDQYAAVNGQGTVQRG